MKKGRNAAPAILLKLIKNFRAVLFGSLSFAKKGRKKSINAIMFAKRKREIKPFLTNLDISRKVVITTILLKKLNFEVL